jgi:hypothetical protein
VLGSSTELIGAGGVPLSAVSTWHHHPVRSVPILLKTYVDADEDGAVLVGVDAEADADVEG